MTLSSLVCRTCLGIISENKTGYSIEDEGGLVRNVQNIREMIGFCFPELNTYVSVKPSICETCLTLLINSYNFKIRCMKVESVIQNYIQTNNVMEGSCVNLNNVVRLQILEALKQKNWPMDLIKEYVSKVDACLAKTRPPLLNYLNNSKNNNTPTVSSNIPDVCIDITDSDDEAPRISYNLPSVSQENYLSTLNLINCNTLREEVSLVQSAQEKYNSRQRTRNFVKSVGSKLRQIRRPNVSCMSVEEINANSDDSEEVLIMNFVENEDLLGNAGSHLKEAYMSDTINLKSRKAMKRKLTPQETVEEILSKRRKLVVKINPNLPYLHKNKSLSVRLDKSSCYKCTFCKYSCLSMDDMNLHHNRLHKTCKLCNYKCGTKPVLDKHLNQEHEDEVKSILELHNNDQSFPCYCCKYVALSKADLRDHRSKEHLVFNDLGVYKCPIPDCDIENADYCYIIKHLENIHDSAKKRECPLCNHKSIGKPYDAKLHVQTHSLFSEACTFCELRFRTSSLLKNHMEKKHSVPIRKHQSGMVYDFTGDHLNLTTNEDGVVMLGQTSSQPDVACNDRAGSGIYGWNHPSLVEMLCSSSLRVAREREDDCVIVDENNDQDCMIVESNSEPIVVDDDFSFHDWILQGQPPNSPIQEAEVITIDDDDDDMSTVKTSDNIKGETANNSTKEGVNDKSTTELKGLEETLNVTAEKNVEETSDQNNDSSAKLNNTTCTLDYPQVLGETTSLETTACGAEANKINSSQETEQAPKEQVSSKNDNDKQSQSKNMQEESTTESLEVTSSQEPLQLQNLEQSISVNTKNQPTIEETLESLEEMETENTVDSREVTSSQDHQQLQDPDGSLSANEENQQNIEDSLDSPEKASSNKHDDNQTQKTEEMQSKNCAELREVTSSQERLQLQNPEESIGDNTEENQLNIEETSESLNEEDSNKDDKQSQNSEEMQLLDAVDSRVVTSSQARLQLHGLNESVSDKESQLNVEETLQTLEEQDSSKNEGPLGNITELKKVSSSKESSDLQELSKYTTDPQKQLEEQTFSNEETLQQVEGIQTTAESINVTSSQKLTLFSTQELSLEAELVKTLNEQINAESSSLNSLEMIQPPETSTFPENDDEFLSEMATLTTALLNMDETGSENDFGLTDNNCEVSSSNLLDDISQPTDEIGKFGTY